MRLVVLGGSAFVGRHLVEAALARGHDVATFTRGRTNPGLFPDVEHLRGDRECDLSALAGREFDAAIDTSGYVPRIVRSSAELLSQAVERYVFISTISVYEEAETIVESTPTQKAEDPDSEDVSAAYGPLKALCEAQVEASFPGRSLVIRPGLIVGAHDYTGRFSYWPRRVAEGGEVLAPGRPGIRVWLIDARDLAEWTIRMVESRATGTYNATGPPDPLTMGGLLEECRAVTGGDATFTWASDAFLLAHGVLPYTELPLWVPDLDGGYPVVDVSKAVAAGLTFRPIADTICSVLESSPEADLAVARSFGREQLPAGLPSGRERSLLADWHASQEAEELPSAAKPAREA